MVFKIPIYTYTYEPPHHTTNIMQQLTKSVLADGRSDTLDADGAEVLAVLVALVLNELLHIHVVTESRDENVNVSHDLQDVQSLV